MSWISYPISSSHTISYKTVLKESIMMQRRITLQEAFTAWCAQPAPDVDRETHLDFLALYELLLQPAATVTQAAHLHHLTRCPRCLQELKGMAESLRELQGADAVTLDEATVSARLEALRMPATEDSCEENSQDEVIARAAASELQGPKRIPTNGGMYTIVMRRNIADKRKSLMTVEVASAYRKRLEGKIVSLRDGRGYILIRGKIINGKVSAVVEEIDKVVPHFLVEAE